MRRLVAIVLLGCSASACVGVSQFDQRIAGADARDRAHAFCKSLGAIPGTDPYVTCRRKIDETGSLDEVAWRTAIPDQRVIGLNTRAVSAPKP